MYGVSRASSLGATWKRWTKPGNTTSRMKAAPSQATTATGSGASWPRKPLTSSPAAISNISTVMIQ